MNEKRENRRILEQFEPEMVVRGAREGVEARRAEYYIEVRDDLWDF